MKLNLPQARVVLTEIELPFWSIVSLMLKWSFAAIPAAIVLAVVWGVSVFLVTSAGILIHGAH